MRTRLLPLAFVLSAAVLVGAEPDAPEMTPKRTDVAPFEYQPATVPFYPAKQKWGTLGEPINRMQKPLTVAESAKHYVTPKGFEVRPFVTEDQLGGKPLAIAWDERGRLWVSLTRDYPNELQPEGQGQDRIVVCEDANGDGACDTVTEFADKLSIPTSVLPYAGGVIVHQAPHTLFLKDTDGDGKADLRQAVLTGWGTNDTHAGPSSLRYGFDNWVYGAVGYAGFRGTVAGEDHRFRQGFYRFKLEPEPGSPHKLKATKLEFLRSTNNNTWGFGFTEDGLMFGSTANGCPIVFLPIPNRYYEKVRGLNPRVLENIAPNNQFHPIADNVRQVDWHDGFTAGAGLTVYTARTYPKEYWNRTAFVCEPTGHLTAAFVLQPKGGGFAARYGWNPIASDDEWAAPVQTEVGPDGHVWFLDWYNFIVQHNPTPKGFKTGKGQAYETDLRDKTRGRVYRLVYTGVKAEKPFTLKDATPDQLVAALKNPNLTWRQHAQRLLVARGNKDVAPKLLELTKDKSVDGAGLNVGAIHALWTLDGLGATAEAAAAAEAGLTHPSAGVRRAAAQVIDTGAGDKSVAAIIRSGVLNDPNAQVRLAALLALADTAPNGAAGQALAAALPKFDSFSDRVMSEALTVAAAMHADSFLAALPDQPLPGAAKVLEAVAKGYAEKGKGDKLPAVLAAVAKAAPDARDAVLAGLAAGWPADKPIQLPPEGTKALTELFAEVPASSKLGLLKLASAWGAKGLDAQIDGIVNGLLAKVGDEKAAEAARLDAAKQAAAFRPGDAAVAGKLLAALTPQASPTLAAGLLEAIGPGQAAAAMAKVKGLPPAARSAGLKVLLTQPEASAAFLDAVETGDLRFDLIALDQKTALAVHPDKAIAERAKKLLALGGGLPDPNRQKVIDELSPVVLKGGDPAAGKKAFTQHCAKCHKHGGEGQQIGPDLTGMATHPREELLIHILDPSRSVEGNYKAYVAKTLDGRVITGLLAAETRTSVELIDAENKRFALNRDDLDELTESSKSLMPEGFEKQAKPEELTDLLAFLTAPGRFLPLPLDKVATALTTRGLFDGGQSTDDAMAFEDWQPKEADGIPLVLTDPQGFRVPNAILLHGPNGAVPPKMPKAVSIPCGTGAKAIHILGGVAGWGYPAEPKGTVSMTVRLHYADGTAEDHPLVNGVQIADFIRREDVPGSKFAFALKGGKQVRLVAVVPKRADKIDRIELVKGPDATAPVVMAVTVETGQ